MSYAEALQKRRIRQPVRCDQCQATLGKRYAGRVLVTMKSRVLAIHDDGTVDMTCPSCGGRTKLPLRSQEAGEPNNDLPGD